MEAVLTRLPTVPVIVTANVPMAAVLLAVNVRVLEPALLVGLKEAVTPAGRPDADKLTLEVKPFRGVTVIVLVAVVFKSTVRLLGDADRE